MADQPSNKSRFSRVGELGPTWITAIAALVSALTGGAGFFVGRATAPASVLTASNPQAPGDPVSSATSSNTIATSTATATATVTTATTAATATSFDGEVRLTYGTGVDLYQNQTQGVEVAGPNGDVDLFLKQYDPVASASVLANGSDFYADDGPEKDAQARCAQTLKAQEHPSLFYVGVGDQYCFATSRGDTGWLRINDYSFKEDIAADYIVLNVKVWKKSA